MGGGGGGAGGKAARENQREKGRPPACVVPSLSTLRPMVPCCSRARHSACVACCSGSSLVGNVVSPLPVPSACPLIVVSTSIDGASLCRRAQDRDRIGRGGPGGIDDADEIGRARRDGDAGLRIGPGDNDAAEADGGEGAGGRPE